MNRRVVLHLRDWLLEYLGNNQYELIKKDSLSVTPILAKDAMDAENQCRQIIKNAKEEKEGQT